MDPANLSFTLVQSFSWDHWDLLVLHQEDVSHIVGRLNGSILLGERTAIRFIPDVFNNIGQVIYSRVIASFVFSLVGDTTYSKQSCFVESILLRNSTCCNNTSSLETLYFSYYFFTLKLKERVCNILILK